MKLLSMNTVIIPLFGPIERIITMITVIDRELFDYIAMLTWGSNEKGYYSNGNQVIETSTGRVIVQYIGE